MVFPTSKLTVGGKSLSDITKEELKAALAKYCAPGFAPIDGLPSKLGRWENVAIHCGKPPDKDGSSELMLSVDLWRPRPVAQRELLSNDDYASPHKHAVRVKGNKSVRSRYDEPAAVLIYLSGPDPEGTLAGLVKER